MSDARLQWKKALEPTPECIDLARLGEERTAAEQEHLLACPRCQAEAALFQEFLREAAGEEEARDGRSIAAELQRRLEPKANVREFRPRSGSLLAAAAVLVLAIGTAFWLDNREPSLDSTVSPQGVYRSERIEGVSPSGEIPEAPRALQWKAVPGRPAYEVNILEIDGTLLWSGVTENTAISLAESVRTKFAPGRTLLWKVTARRGREIVASSGIMRTRVTLDAAGRVQR